MKVKTVGCVALLFFAICCFSPAFGETAGKVDDEAAWSYHPGKDASAGSYEWWYLDAHLDNGYLVTIAFQVPSVLAPKYVKYHSDLSGGLPVPKYDPKNYAQVSFVVNDEKGRPIFYATEDADPGRIGMPGGKNMTVRLNNCRLEMKKTGALPTFVARMDIRDASGNTAKANVVFDAVVPAAKAGRGRTFDAVVDGKHLYDEWAILASAAKVKADISITNKETGGTMNIRQNGFGYHDKNWGNHFVYDTSKGWIWARIAEDDLTIVFSEAPNICGDSVYPTFQPCIIVHNGRPLAATEALDYVKGAAAAGRLAYPTELTINFKPESGVKGTLKLYGLKMIFEYGPYSRLTGSWALDIESEYGKLKRDGNDLLFEFCDFTVK
jgi:hypothetical protein